MGFNCANVKVGKRRCGDEMLPLDLAALAPSAVVMLEAPTSRLNLLNFREQWPWRLQVD